MKKVPKSKQNNNITYNGSFMDKETFSGKFSYSFNFVLVEPIIYIRDSLPVKDKESEVIELLKENFSRALKEYFKNNK